MRNRNLTSSMPRMTPCLNRRRLSSNKSIGVPVGSADETVSGDDDEDSKDEDEDEEGEDEEKALVGDGGKKGDSGTAIEVRPKHRKRRVL